MAAGAGEVAARQSALPIAQGDAQEYANVDSANQAATNTLAGQKLDYAGRVDSTRIGAAAQIHSAQIQAANALQLQ